MRFNYRMFIYSLSLFTALSGRLGAETLLHRPCEPPQIKFKQASMSKSDDTIHAIKDQLNFIPLYITPFKEKAKYDPERMEIQLLLPPFCQVMSTTYFGVEYKYKTEPVVWNNKKYLKVTWKDQKRINWKCIKRTEGTTSLVFFFKIPSDANCDGYDKIQCALLYDGKIIAKENATLRIFEKLETPRRISPDKFIFFLHAGGSPMRRPGHSLELTDYLRKIGVNAVVVMTHPNYALKHLRDKRSYMSSLKNKGFRIIIQRSGSYHVPIWKIDSPNWFHRQNKGKLDEFYKLADMVMWDYERGGPSSYFKNKQMISKFAKRNDINLPLTRADIMKKHSTEWYDFIQNEFALPIQYWSSYIAEKNSKLKKLVVQNTVMYFNLWMRGDYKYYNSHTDFHGPMFFNNFEAVKNVLKWEKRIGTDNFIPCLNQNAFKENHVSSRGVALQLLSAVLINCKGMLIHPGCEIDAEDFVELNGLMMLLGQYQNYLLNKSRQNHSISIDPLPKEVYVDNRKGEVGTATPNWKNHLITKAFSNKDKTEFLIVVNNNHPSLPCYTNVKIPDADKNAYVIIDAAVNSYYKENGTSNISSRILKNGFVIKTPPFSYKFILIKVISDNKHIEKSSSQVTILSSIRKEYAENYLKRVKSPFGNFGDLKLSLSDFDNDGEKEYLLELNNGKVYFAKNGNIKHWSVGDASITGEDAGFCRDMLWFPLGDRSNAALDVDAELLNPTITENGFMLTFRKTVELRQGGIELLFQKTYLVENAASIKVAVEIKNVSDLGGSVDVAYRVHNYFKHQPKWGANKLWLLTTEGLHSYRNNTVISSANTTLSPKEKSSLFTASNPKYITTPSYRTIAAGEFFPNQKVLIAFKFRSPEKNMQILSWGTPLETGSITNEWIYRTISLAVTKKIKYEYNINFCRDVPSLNLDSLKQSLKHVRNNNKISYYHFRFDGNCNPDSGKVKIAPSETLSFVASRDKQGVSIPKGTEVSLKLLSKLSLRHGKLSFFFKPNWHPADGKNHYLLRLNTDSGLALGIGIINLSETLSVFGPVFYNGGKVKRNAMTADGAKIKPGEWNHFAINWNAETGSLRWSLNDEVIFDKKSKKWSFPDNPNGRVSIQLHGLADSQFDDLKIYLPEKL